MEKMGANPTAMEKMTQKQRIPIWRQGVFRPYIHFLDISLLLWLRQKYFCLVCNDFASDGITVKYEIVTSLCFLKKVYHVWQVITKSTVIGLIFIYQKQIV